MWITTLDGYYSVVEVYENEDRLMVRARDRRDLDRMMEKLPRRFRFWRWLAGWKPPFRTPHADYPWRVIMSRSAFAGYLGRATRDLDYGNFKNAVSATRGPKRAAVYGRVWAALLALEPDRDAYMIVPWEHNPLDEPPVLGQPRGDELDLIASLGRADSLYDPDVRVPFVGSARPFSTP